MAMKSPGFTKMELLVVIVIAAVGARIWLSRLASRI